VQSRCFLAEFSDFAIGESFARGWLHGPPLLQGCVVTPWLDVPIRLAELVSYSVFIGIFWAAASTVRKGLTRRWSERRTAVRPHLR
jgi:hypothetical protein